MDLSCSETMNLNDVENDSENQNGYKVEVPVVVVPQSQIQQQQVKSVITKLYFEANVDPTFLKDRCLENLLTSEQRYQTPCFYFDTIQKNHVTPEMRKMVSDWVIELCEEQRCQEEVSILAINYMDRVMNKLPISKNNLQLLAATCIFLASKLREPSARALPPHILIYYTDHSITKRDLMEWELMVLGCLKWDVSFVTPLDFLELLITRLPIQNKNCGDIDPDRIRKHAQAFISLAVREHEFSIYSASNIAAASIAASLAGMKWHIRSNISLMDLLDKLAELTQCETKYILSCMTTLEKLFEEQRRNLYSMYNSKQTMITPLKESAKYPMEQKHIKQQQTRPATTFQRPKQRYSPDKKQTKSITPVDVQDVQF